MVNLLRKPLALPICGLVLGSILLIRIVVSPVLADMGVQPILPGGSNIQPEGETPIQMASEKVVLNVRPATEVDDTVVIRNPTEYGLSGSFDGSPGMYPAMADVLADFTMVNPTNEVVSMTAWFPLASALETEEWNLNPGEVVPRIERFQVIIDSKPLEYIVNELSNPKGEDKPSLPWASFPVVFPPGEETNVQISYVVPAWWDYNGLTMTLYYVLQTGAGWAGPIGKAELVVNLPYTASVETIYTMPDGGQVDGHQVRWTWENLEPNPQDDFFIRLLLLNRWDEVQAARAVVAADPRDGEAWLNLTSIYRTLTRGKSYSAARMLPGFGEIYQPLGIQAAEEALRLMPSDGRPHCELALLYASALPENASWEDLQPVMDELKVVEELEPALAPNIHDALDFLGAFWAVETVRAEASSIPGQSATNLPIQKPTYTSSPSYTLIPSSITQPQSITQPTTTETTGNGQGWVILVLAGVIGLVVVGYLLVQIMKERGGM